jgi:hypothetical protein
MRWFSGPTGHRFFQPGPKDLVNGPRIVFRHNGPAARLFDTDLVFWRRESKDQIDGRVAEPRGRRPLKCARTGMKLLRHRD